MIAAARKTTSPISFASLPFDEAIKYLHDKVDLPTERWTDLWQGMHSRAFVVAGAMKQELLADLHGAVEKALTEGATLADFRKDFDRIVARHGWSYKGGRGWRTGVIYNTNLRVAHAAGAHAQMMDPDVLAVRPYLRYVASISREKRPEHMRWYNTVLRYDDPWWHTHRPPNGWGCKCSVTNHSGREIERMKAEGVDIKTTAPKTEYYDWTNPATGQTIKVPKGIDPGWAYNPGEAAWGTRISEEAMAAWEAQGAAAWERLTPTTWATLGRPRVIPADPPQATLGPRLESPAAAETALEGILGGKEKVFSFDSKGFRYDVLVNAETLARHIVDLSRTPFLPFLPETMADPFEVWLSFERHKGTGRVVLRQRIVKAIQFAKQRGMLVVAQAANGVMEAWTIVPTDDFKYLNNQRQGKLLYAK